MAFSTTHLSLAEHCRQVVLAAPANAIGATYASALATSPLIPQNCRVVAWDVPCASSHDTSPDSPAVSNTKEFAQMMSRIEAKMVACRAPRPTADVTRMTQFFYGGVSPKETEIHPMLQRVEVCNGARADIAAAVAAGAVAVADTVFVLVLNAQVLGTDVNAGLQPYETFLRAVWVADAPVTAATQTAGEARAATAAVPAAASPAPLSAAASRQGSLIVLADNTYRVAATALVKSIAETVSTSVRWTVQLAFVHAMDPPALEFGAAEAAVEDRAGLAHGGTLPVLCAANALGVLRHFPVSRSEPATITPVDVALNAALLGHIFLCAGELPECRDRVEPVAAALPTPRHRMASFAVAESHRPGEASLVWGMFGEYLMGYYGRFTVPIAAAFPVAGVLAANPLLQFPFNVRDVVNFGPEPRCPTYLLEGWRAYQDRQRVTGNFHGAVVTQKMQACVQQLDDALGGITGAARSAAALASRQQKSGAVSPRRRASATSSFALGPYTLDGFNVAPYHYLLRRLTTHYGLMPYHQCVALSAVDWEAYISVVARSTLVHLAHCVLLRTAEGSEPAATPVRRLGGAVDIAGIAGVKLSPAAPEAEALSDSGDSGKTRNRSGLAGSTTSNADAAAAPFAFPEPRRSFTNDLIYHGPDRAPPFPSLTREFFTFTTFLHRTALRPNGWRSDMTPGMTPKTLTTILAQPHIQQLMTALAAQDGTTKAEVEAQAKRILLLAGDTLNHPQCRTMGLMVREIFKRIYHRVNVNHGAFERLQRQLQMPRVALVYVPLHRSYIDFLILSFLLAEMASPMPHIVAGDGFLSMGPIATLMRGSGAFFMRRTFRGDPLYAALFKEYVRQMMLSYRPLEFFIEGTRSRTGKTMAPKMGLLKFVCDTFFDPMQQELDDVLFIPVSVSYDELLEATMYAKELLGVPKPKENLSNFLKASSTLQRMHGSINLHLGDPISLRSLKEHPQQCPLPYQPKTDTPDVIKHETAARSPSSSAGGAAKAAPLKPMSSAVPRGSGLAARKPAVLNTTPAITKPLSPTPPSILSSVAWHLTYQLQRNIVITPASMVAALLECFSPYYSTRALRAAEAAPAPAQPQESAETTTAQKKAVECAPPAKEAAGVPLAVMENGVAWLRGILLERGARLSAEAATWSGDRIVKTALGNLHSFAHLANGMSTVSYQQPDNVVTRLGVNISANQLIHVCIDEAVVAVVAQAFGSPTSPHHPPTPERATQCGTRAVKSEVLANHAQLLQRLLSTEFPNYAASTPVAFTSWLECTVCRLQHSPASTAAVIAAAASPSPSSGEAAAARSHGPLTTVPVTPYYYFLLQLICPHLEAIFVVLLAAVTLLHAYPGQPLGAADVVNTTQKACRSLFEERKLNYAVTANKETLQHYYESLISLSLLQLGRLPPPAEKAKAASSQGTVVYKVGALGQQKVLERLDVLATQVQKFLWYPGAEAECVVDTKAVKDRILSVYKELTQPSKM